MPASNNYAGGFGSALMLKDLGLALDAARGVGQPLPLGESAHDGYTTLCKTGHFV